MFSSGKTILVLADEIVSVYASVRGRYDFIGEVEWRDVGFVPNLAELLSGKGRGKPVMILYDMVEQYYRKENVPKVAVLDQQNVLLRRLTAAFPNYPMRGYLLLKNNKKKQKFITLTAPPKEKGGKETGGMEGIPYLFAAIPAQDLLSKLTEAITMAMISSKGIFLLPIESVPLVRQLSNSLNEGAPSEDSWTVFMSQHHGGGLRQIVVRNGELALTRLTPIVGTDIDPKIWSDEVFQEFTATMGYLSRFGYTASSELEVIVVGGTSALEILKPQIKSTRFYGVTVGEAARALRLSVRTDGASRYGDVLHVGWLARQVKHVLPFKFQALDYISRVRMGGKAAALVLVLGALGVTGFVGQSVSTLIQTISDVQDNENKLRLKQQEYEAELKRKEDFGIDVKLVQGSIAIYDQLEKGKTDIISFLQNVSDALAPDMYYDTITLGYENSSQQNPDPLAPGVIESRKFVATIDLSVPADMKPELANKKVSDFRSVLAEKVGPGYDVSIVKAIEDLTYRRDISIEAGQQAKEVVETGSNTAQFKITQKVGQQNDQPAGN